ncbi:hypothetical protein [Flexithrix dorotheae]|uniref:hypothetical protein n=1 Tax=Flexithrix dorotheae TaxID=70993 RepID=UPI000361D6A2|nr:hypothetical protein [Flexithrix dorotheae]
MNQKIKDISETLKLEEITIVLKRVFSDLKGWDWKIIIICFTTAFIFWVFNALNAEQTSNFSFPVKFVYSGEQIITIQEPPSDIQINVTGNGWNLFKKSFEISSSPLVIRIDNPVNSNFVATRSLLPEITDRLKEIQVNFIQDDSLFFKFDTLSSKLVYIKVDTTQITLADRYKITSPIFVEPKRFNLVGASSFVGEFQDTFTIKLEESNIDEDFDQNLPIEIESELINADLEEVKVKFFVTQFERRKINVSLELINFPEDSVVSIQPGTAVVNYSIAADEQFMPQDSLNVILDYKQLNRLDSSVCPTVVTPDYFSDVELQPAEFKVTIEE